MWYILLTILRKYLFTKLLEGLRSVAASTDEFNQVKYKDTHYSYEFRKYSFGAIKIVVVGTD